MQKPPELMQLETLAMYIVGYAKRHGYVVEIRTEPTKPLRMGGYDMVYDIRPDHNSYRNKP